MLTLVAAVIVLGFVRSAGAENVGATLKEFGLLGVWSTNCAKDPSREVGDRSTYAAPIFGPVTITIVKHLQNHVVFRTIMEIKTAIRITNDKLKYEYIITSSKAEVPNAPERDALGVNAGMMFTNVFERLGPKVRLFKSRSNDGKILFENGEQVVHAPNGDIRIPSVWVEKCLN